MRLPAPITRTLALAALQLSLAIVAAHAQYQGGIWRPTSGPYGGIITTLITTAEGAMIVGTPAGLYRSTDNGGNWVQENGPMPIAPTYALARDSAGVLYAATMSGVFRSTNDGIMWAPLDITPAQDIRSLAIYNGTRLIAGGLNRTYQWDSAMSRRTTYFCSFNPSTTYLTAIAVQNGIIYAGTSNAGFHYSENMGKTMKPMEGLPCNAISSLETRPLISGGAALAVGTSCGLYRWTTDVPVWTEFTGPLSGRPIGAVKLAGNALFAGTKGFGIFRTLDGVNWTEVYNGMENPTINTIECALDSSIYCGTMHGVQRSENMGERWEAVSRGIRATNIRSLLVDERGYIFATTETGIYRSYDTGASWQEKNYLLTDRDVQSITMDYENILWAGTRNGKLFRSTDYGDSWEEREFVSSSPIESIVWDGFGTLHVSTSGAEGGVHSSSDYGRTWRQNLKGDSRSMAHNSGSALYATTVDQGLYYASNGGSSWNKIRSVLGYTSVAAFGGKVAIGGQQRVELSTNVGATWNNVKAPPCGSIRSMLFDEFGNLIIGTGCGVYRSNDNGVTWLEDRTGLNARQVTALGRQQNFGKFVVAGTDGAGVYIRDNTTASVGSSASQGDISAPAIHISANALALDISRPGHYVVTLYNPLGQQIATLADEQFDIGIHQRAHSFDELAPGIYLLQVRGNGSVATTKVVVDR
jgi:ligand-binding sensor domain-containing protein